MNIAIQGVHLALTDALEEYVNRRFASLGRVLGRFELQQDLTLRVDIGRITRHHQKGDVFSVAVSLRIGRVTLHVEQTGGDVRRVVDDAQKRFKEIVEDYKERTQKRDKVAIDKAKMKL
ncbi:MAG: HPF/RaiA family ribosome-associated protein [Candidatus Paceibacterota bacterium]|jgi:ribosomal subunit interface protein